MTRFQFSDNLIERLRKYSAIKLAMTLTPEESINQLQTLGDLYLAFSLAEPARASLEAGQAGKVEILSTNSPSMGVSNTHGTF